MATAGCHGNSDNVGRAESTHQGGAKPTRNPHALLKATLNTDRLVYWSSRSQPPRES